MRLTIGLVFLLGACATGEDLLLVANKDDATLAIIRARSRETVALLPTGVGPHEVAASPDGQWAVVSNYGDKEKKGNSLTVVDLGTRTVVRTIDLDKYERPHGSAFLPDGRMLVTSETSETLVVVDVAAGKIERAIPTGQKTSHMVAVPSSGSRAYTANIVSGTVSVIDVASGKSLATAPAGNHCEGITVSPDGSEVWVGSNEDHAVHVFDGTSLAEKTVLQTGEVPIRLRFVPDGSRVLVSAAGASKLQFFDATTKQMLGAIEFAPADGEETAAPAGLIVDPDSKFAYVSLVARDEVAVIDIARMAEVGRIKTGHVPDGIAYARRR